MQGRGVSSKLQMFDLANYKPTRSIRFMNEQE